MKHTGKGTTITGTAAKIALTNRVQSHGPIGTPGGKRRLRKMEVQKMKPVISTMTKKQDATYTYIAVWNRGEPVGELKIRTLDAAEIIGRLEGASVHIRQIVAGRPAAPPLAL